MFELGLPANERSIGVGPELKALFPYFAGGFAHKYCQTSDGQPDYRVLAEEWLVRDGLWRQTAAVVMATPSKLAIGFSLTQGNPSGLCFNDHRTRTEVKARLWRHVSWSHRTRTN